MSFLGIDIGSSQVKAVVFDEAGRPLASSYGKYAFQVPEPGAMELDSREVLAACRRVIVETAEQVHRADPVEALAISSQGEAFTPVDAAGQPLAPAMISGDSRASAVVAEFADTFGRDRLYRITGHTPSGMFSIAKLLWLSRFRPRVRERAVRFLCFEDLLVAALGAEPAMGWPLAGRTMLFDVTGHAWSAELLAAIGFQAGEFARPCRSGTVVGEVSCEAAGRFGLTPGTRIVAGGHDQVVAALGCGVRRPGTAMYAAGSVECLVPVARELTFSERLCSGNLCSYDYVLPGMYASLGYSLTGSNLLEYFIREFAPDLNGDYAALTASMPEAPTSLLTIPYFTPSGTPYFDSHTPGTVYGWRLGCSRGELLKGLEEGIGLEMKLNFELLRENGFPIETLIASGGGFRQPALVQLRADILGTPIQVTTLKEAGCRGAALLAESAVRGCPVDELPGSRPEISGEFRPDPERAARYHEKFEKWQMFSKLIRENC